MLFFPGKIDWEEDRNEDEKEEDEQGSDDDDEEKEKEKDGEEKPCYVCWKRMVPVAGDANMGRSFSISSRS